MRGLRSSVSPRGRAGAWLVGSLLSALAPAGCDYLEDRLITCTDLRVDLVNSRQSGSGVYIAAEGEGATPETYLDPGATRRILECVRKGDRRTYRAFRDTELIGQATCVVSRNREALGAVVSRVEWVPGGFRCENW
jgi:hypothetical protein